MKYVFFILFFISLNSLVTGTNYYVSSSGNDTNNGLSESTSWKTITKVNSVFSTFQPGDRILFKRGDTFYGALVIKKSGLSGAPITIGAYGTGAQPVITGFTTLSSWTSDGDGIYSAQVTSSAQTNMVTVNGIQAGMGRFPDAGTNLTYSTATTTSIVDPDIGDATDWSGAELAINKNDWTLDRCRITDHTGDAFTFVNLGSDNTPDAGRYYFIQNDLRCVTALNEWYHSTSSGRLYIYGNPSSKTIKIATLNYLIDNASYDYITVDGVNFQGSTSHAIYCAYGSNNWTIQNCTISFAGHSGIHFVGGNNANINNNAISWCNASGIYAVSNNCTIINNSVLHIGMIPGQSLFYHPISIYISGLEFIVQYNDIQYSGWSGIASANGSTFTIKNNFVNYSCQFLDDGGSIYLTRNAGSLCTVEGNIVLNSGVGGSDNDITRGIYLDDVASNVLVKDNTTVNCIAEGIANHGGINNTYIGNTSYNNSAGILFQQNTASDKITGTQIRNNIFFARESGQYANRFLAPTDNILDFGNADYNYYLRPIKDDDVIITYDPSIGSVRRTLEEWQYLTGQDANSEKSPIAITDINDIRFEYNVSKTNKIIALDRPVIDARGTKYESSISLLPYTSTVLINVPDPAFPVVPIYIISIVENISPTRIEMTYDQILANITPSTTAFKVLVNSLERTVKAITISGTKVVLTLSSPISEGDIVAIAYTRPATNPLQSASTGLAESFTAKAVTNKVDARRPGLISCSVENDAPNILKMAFNLTLASFIPQASAFTVKVNSVPRIVSSVQVSGTDVFLTLSSPIVSGDAITVAYTTPLTNALRSALGWYVLSFNPQSVTNNVGSSRPVLVSSSVENSAPNNLEMTYSLDLADITPPASAFTVMVNSVARTVNTVAISGRKVSLTLASSVVSGDVVTVAYTIPSTNSLRSVPGFNVLSFSAQPVTNNVNGYRPILVSCSVESATPNILAMTFSLNLSSIVPPASAFTVMVNSVRRTVNTVSISGTAVSLTLASSIVSGDVITVAYTIPSTNALRSVPGWYVLSFTPQLVTNNVGSSRPVLVSSSVENSAPNNLEMTYSLDLADITPPASAFTVMVNSVARTVNTVAISGRKVSLTLASSLVSGDVVTVAYTIPSTNSLRSVPGFNVLSFSAQPVTNNVNGYRPILVSCSVESATSNILAMTFSLNLSSIVPPASAFTVMVNSVRRTVNTISISGTAVSLTLASSIVSGDVITVAYTIPSTNALRSVPGWYVLSFNPQSVTNNVSGFRPVLVSAALEYVTPNILDMTFSLTLSGSYVPPTGAFIVMVNSVKRAVNTVLISGTKVQLTLSSPVVYGDVITVAYTIPSTNALRSVPGWWILSFSSQPVINKCIGNKSKIAETNDSQDGNISIYPNPANEFINVFIPEPSSKILIIKLFDYSGRLCQESRLDPDINYFNIPIELKQGSYILKIVDGSVTIINQKLIVL